MTFYKKSNSYPEVDKLQLWCRYLNYSSQKDICFPYQYSIEKIFSDEYLMGYFDNLASIFLETIVKEAIDFECINNGIREMTVDEINSVSGAGATTSGAALGLVGAIGAATFGSAWGAVGVGAAIAAAPVAVVAMVGLAAYAGYSYFSPGGGGTGGDKKQVMAR